MPFLWDKWTWFLIRRYICEFRIYIFKFFTVRQMIFFILNPKYCLYFYQQKKTANYCLLTVSFLALCSLLSLLWKIGCFGWNSSSSQLRLKWLVQLKTGLPNLEYLNFLHILTTLPNRPCSKNSCNVLFILIDCFCFKV